MRLFNATPLDLGWPRAAGLPNHVLFRDRPWLGHCGNRNTQPTDALLDEALAAALKRSPHVLYLDDSQALSPTDLLKLAQRVQTRTPVPLVCYGQPIGGDAYARNTLTGNRWTQRLWDQAERWRTPRVDRRGFEQTFAYAAPSLYLKPGVAWHTGLTPVQAWQTAAAETLLATRSRCGLPVLAFVAVLDPDLAKQPKACHAIAKNLARWELDCVLWQQGGEPGIDQSTFAQSLEAVA